MQGLMKTPAVSGSAIEEIPDRLNRSHVQGSVSAFSRYAAIYGLHKDVRYGLACYPVDSNVFSKTTQGSWICNSKNFYYTHMTINYIYLTSVNGSHFVIKSYLSKQYVCTTCVLLVPKMPFTGSLCYAVNAVCIKRFS